MTDEQRISKRTTVVKAIHTAFKGVTLGQGISLRQANVDDLHGEYIVNSDYKIVPISCQGSAIIFSAIL